VHQALLSHLRALIVLANEAAVNLAHHLNVHAAKLLCNYQGFAPIVSRALAKVCRT